MSNSSLHPPNSHLLTDNVIGAVVARSVGPRFDAQKTESAASKATSQQPSVPVIKTNSNPASAQAMGSAWNSLSTAEKALQLQRSRQRRIQQRYRKNQEGKTTSLAEEVSSLKVEVQNLKLRLRFPPCNSTPWRAVVEFVRLFRNGFQGPATTKALLLPESHTQKKFLRATMTPNVAFNDGYGVDAVLDNWRSRSAHHEKLQVRLVRLDQGPDNLLLAYLIISEVISREVLLRCFGDETPAFACKLLGRELEVPTCVHFRWDEQERRFDSVHYEVDMLTPLFKLLGNLEDASAVLNSPLGVD